jgi:hypothetical protein
VTVQTRQAICNGKRKLPQRQRIESNNTIKGERRNESISFVRGFGVLFNYLDFGTWTVGTTTNGEYVYAATANDSGNVFGQYCSPSDETCYWLLRLNLTCKIGDSYPLLVNADSGAIHLSVYCFNKLNDSMFQYAMTDFDKTNVMIRGNSRIGFAFPLQSDQFRVIRFDLGGAIAAVNSMLEKAQELKAKAPKNTRDKVI